MTAYEQIRQQFNNSAACRYGEKPRLEYEPGCSFIQCARDDCKCRLNDGDGVPTTAFLIEWNARFADDIRKAHTNDQVRQPRTNDDE